jgi:hypothetical protein
MKIDIVRRKILCTIFLVTSIFLCGTQKTQAAIDVDKLYPYDSQNSLRVCFCCADSVTVSDATTSTNGSIDYCSSLKVIGYYQFASPCEQACANNNYKSFLLYDYSQSKYGNNFISNRLSNVTKTKEVKSTSSSAQITDESVPGTTESSGIIQCGRPGQNMCTLCDMIAGINTIIQYLMKIAIGAALLALAIGGIMYVVSSGDPELIEKAKTTIKNALIGFIIIFAGYVIVNTTILYLGTKQGMGINAQWGTFVCNSTAAQHVQE